MGSLDTLANTLRRSATPSTINSPPLLFPQNSSVVQTPSQANVESTPSVVLSQHDSSHASTGSDQQRTISPFKPEASKRSDIVQYLPLAYKKPNPDFSGRKAVLEQMGHCLLSARSNSELSMPQAYVLSGPAGIGKTQLALQFLHERKTNFDVVLWIPAQSVDSLFIAFHQIAIKLGLETEGNKKGPVASRETVKGWLAEPLQDFRLHRGNTMSWILVFDDADKPDIIYDFWPHGGQGSVVITSRDPMAASNLYFGETGIKLDTMIEADAVDLVQRLLKPETSPGLDQILLEVARKLHCYPLALVHMAGVMRRLGYAPARFLQVYQK